MFRALLSHSLRCWAADLTQAATTVSQVLTGVDNARSIMFHPCRFRLLLFYWAPPVF
jgi:hypothetical protein